MPMRLGPGPVFIYESLAAVRRWQTYASRSFFVLGALAGLGLGGAWIYLEEGQLGQLDLKDLAQLGEYFYICIATIQLMLVMIVAPAATAGSICMDRARGNLTHMLTTDLGNVEIVLGKLAARMLPLLGMVAATVPVLAMAGLLGGIVPEAIVALTLLTVASAVLGCTLALAFSVRAAKTHEVLMGVYAIEFAWILSPLIWELLREIGIVSARDDWLQSVNPFVLAWAPYEWPNYLTAEWLAWVVGGMLTLSAGLALFAVLRLRGEVVAKAGRRESRLGRLRERLSSWRPGPSLDRDPVLWHKWRRGRPSRLTRIVWGALIVLSVLATGRGIVESSSDPRHVCEYFILVNGFQATFGLLMLSLAAPTVLAEERVRGSLDVLLTTPLSTDRIVLAKWWGAFRIVPALTLLPTIGSIFIAAGAPEVLPGIRRFGQGPAPLTFIDRFALAALPIGLMLAQGAAVASVGLALATWTRRVGRAVAISVAAYAVVAFLGPMLIEVGPEILLQTGLCDNSEATEFVMGVLMSACPIGGQVFSFETARWPAGQSREAFYVGQVIVLLTILGFALVMLALTLATFNRCLGRVSERPRRAPRPPRTRVDRRGPHLRPAGERIAVSSG